MAAASRVAKATDRRCKFIQVEVENADELEQALAAGAAMILLDNEPGADAQAVAITAGRARLEASGNVTLETLRGSCQGKPASTASRSAR